MEKYVLSIDQSTQGTKAMVFDRAGKMIARADLPHRQIVSEAGWVSHDPEEIYGNALKTARMAVEQAGIRPEEVVCLGLSNQRETSVAWNRDTGKPVCDAIVWQCARAADVCAAVESTGIGDMVRARTGIPISPYFPAAKLAWILRNVPEARALAASHRLCVGTIDTWLVWKLTGQYRTDYSNASRTQLFDIHALRWDEEICAAFGIAPEDLPLVTDCDALFGETDLGGLLPRKVPVCGVLGDSHASLFGLGCLEPGMAKASYGTGSSIMMNTGERAAVSRNGLVTSLAWKRGGRVSYVMEGNVNYSAAVVTWLKDSLGLIASPAETEALARAANPGDTTYLVPAFSGLGMPYWNSAAKALICGMTRLTGRAEIARAALDSIAYQIHDVVEAMEKDAGIRIPALRVDGGASRNGYLMQFQSDMLGCTVSRAEAQELSGAGAAYMAGLSTGLYTEDVFSAAAYRDYTPQCAEETRRRLLAGWRAAIAMVQGNR
ncbi:MAG: glycerol kinase GlpK [Clostridia bacterium]|nr:glycerol kinase GlpK [Clostridia bacterium]